MKGKIVRHQKKVILDALQQYKDGNLVNIEIGSSLLKAIEKIIDFANKKNRRSELALSAEKE